jgi:hypothetical protein
MIQKDEHLMNFQYIKSKTEPTNYKNKSNFITVFTKQINKTNDYLN